MQMKLYFLPLIGILPWSCELSATKVDYNFISLNATWLLSSLHDSTFGGVMFSRTNLIIEFAVYFLVKQTCDKEHSLKCLLIEEKVQLWNTAHTTAARLEFNSILVTDVWVRVVVWVGTVLRVDWRMWAVFHSCPEEN